MTTVPHRLRRLMIAAALLALPGVTACGDATAAHSPAPTARTTPTGMPSGSSTSAPCPQQDTPFEQAPAAMQKAWSTGLTYGVKVIPSCSVLAGTDIPWSSVKFVNQSGLTDSQAQAMYKAFLHETTLYNDAKGHGDAGLLHDLGAPAVAGDDYRNALQGTATHEERCAYPTTVTMLPATASEMSLATGQTDTSPGFAFWQVYKGPCVATLTASNGQTSTDTWLAAGSTLIAPVFGVMVDRGPLGTIFTGDGSLNCSNPQLPSWAATCSQVGSAAA